MSKSADMSKECRETMESGSYQSIIEKAKEKINTDVYAQRIVINELVNAYLTRSRKVNDVISEFKKFTKENTKIVSFYLFMAEIYRINKYVDVVRICFHG